MRMWFVLLLILQCVGVIALALLASACGGSESDSSDQSAAVDDTAATDAGDAMADDESMSEDSINDVGPGKRL